MGDILSIFLLILLAILLVGPRKLPAGIEALWLTWTNFGRSQRGGDPLSLDTARMKWQSERNPFFNGIQLLYAASEHLAELRQRLFVALLAFAICVAATFFFNQQIFQALLYPLEKIPAPPSPPTTTIFTLTSNVPVITTVTIPGSENAISVTINLPVGTQLPVTYIQQKVLTPYFTKPTEMFVTTFKVDLYAAAGLTLPVILYEIVAFLLPGLLPNEKKYVFILMPAIAVFFVAGVVFAYFLMLPFAINFLFTFGSDIAQPLPSINDYISFVVSVLFLVGLTFETPLVVFFLAKLHIVDVPRLKSFRRFAIVGSFIIAALVTPTPDPLNQGIVAIPIILLYELGIFLARFA